MFAGVPPEGQAAASKVLGAQAVRSGALSLQHAVYSRGMREGSSQTIYLISREFGGSSEETTCVLRAEVCLPINSVSPSTLHASHALHV